eukprot:g2753.t1
MNFTNNFAAVQFLRRACDLCWLSNPVTSAYCVGCIIVDDEGKTVATGYSREFEGNTHAEECALRKLESLEPMKRKGQLFDMYSTMEPCSTRLSCSESCADRIINSKMIRRVFIGAMEPTDLVKCEGVSILQSAGINVVAVIDANNPNVLKQSMDFSNQRLMKFSSEARELARKICEEALEETGTVERLLAPGGDDWFQGPLTAWCEDLLADPPRLSEFGRAFCRRQAVAAVSRRLQVFDWIDRYPEILEVSLPPIIMIVGFPRTGTTVLHNLLSLHPQGRPMLRWELMYPTPPPEAETWTTDPRVTQTREAAERLKREKFSKSAVPSLHWIDATEPEECAWGFLDCTNFVGHGFRGMMPEWGEWLLTHDMRQQFVNYKKVLQLLLWKNAVSAPDNMKKGIWASNFHNRNQAHRLRDPGIHLVLKCPQLCTCIDDFIKIFPRSKLVLTARCPFRSLLSAYYTFEEISRFVAANKVVRHEDWRRIQKMCFRQQLETVKAYRPDYKQWKPFSNKNKETKNREIHNETVAVVCYRDLVNYPVRAVENIYSQLGFCMPRELSNEIHSFLKRQKVAQNDRSELQKSYPRSLRYGFTARSLWEDIDVKRYTKMFEIESPLREYALSIQHDHDINLLRNRLRYLKSRL